MNAGGWRIAAWAGCLLATVAHPALAAPVVLVPQRAPLNCWAAAAAMARKGVDPTFTGGQCSVAKEALKAMSSGKTCACYDPDKLTVSEDGPCMEPTHREKKDRTPYAALATASQYRSGASFAAPWDLVKTASQAPLLVWEAGEEDCGSAGFGHIVVLDDQDGEEDRCVHVTDPGPRNLGAQFWTTWDAFACGEAGFGQCAVYEDVGSSAAFGTRDLQPFDPKRCGSNWTASPTLEAAVERFAKQCPAAIGASVGGALACNRVAMRETVSYRGRDDGPTRPRVISSCSRGDGEFLVTYFRDGTGRFVVEQVGNAQLDTALKAFAGKAGKERASMNLIVVDYAGTDEVVIIDAASLQAIRGSRVTSPDPLEMAPKVEREVLDERSRALGRLRGGWRSKTVRRDWTRYE